MSNLSFLIIGAQKGGTSSLFYYLTEHPEISNVKKKEVHYFDMNFQKGKNWYISHFENEDKIKGEATPNYLFHPHSSKRIKEEFPNVKLIVLLRNPVDRAISHYYHNVRKGREPLSIQHAFNFENARTEKEYHKMVNDESFFSDMCRHYTYRKRSIYYKQLKSYFEIFEKEQFFIIQSEKFFDNSKFVFDNLWKFLGVDQSFTHNCLDPINKSNIKKDVPIKFYNELKEFYKPYNEKLYDLLGFSYDW